MGDGVATGPEPPALPSFGAHAIDDPVRGTGDRCGSNSTDRDAPRRFAHGYVGDFHAALDVDDRYRSGTPACDVKLLAVRRSSLLDPQVRGISTENR